MSTQIGATWQDTVNAITKQGQASGLSPDQINAAIAVARSEGGLLSSAGDYQNGSATSFGPFQFHLGGELNSFAAWLGTTIGGAVGVAQSSLSAVTQFALQPGGYLYNSLVAGAAKGYSGPDLATYASQYGQISADPGAAGSWYQTLFGSGPGATTTTNPTPVTLTTGKLDTTTPAQELQNLSALWNSLPSPSISMANPFQGIADFANNALNWVTLAFWVLVGILVAIVGLWLLVRSDN